LGTRCTTGSKTNNTLQNILDAREGVLNHLQEKLYAQTGGGSDRLQAMDAAGKMA